MHNLNVRILLLNSYGEARIIEVVCEMKDIQILQLSGGGDESFHALLGHISTPSEREMLQRRAVVRQHSKGDIIDLGVSKVCMCQLGTRCDEMLDVIATEPKTAINPKMNELGTVHCYDVTALAS